jgi:hypothetical protein
MTVLDALRTPALAEELRRRQKNVILLWLAGGARAIFGLARTSKP